MLPHVVATLRFRCNSACTCWSCCSGSAPTWASRASLRRRGRWRGRRHEAEWHARYRGPGVMVAPQGHSPSDLGYCQRPKRDSKPVLPPRKAKQMFRWTPPEL